ILMACLMLVFHQDDDAADFSGVDAGGPLMDPILATGVMAIGRKMADSLIARYSNPKPSQASPAFADVLASQKVSASGRSQADPRDLATRIANLEQTLMHSPEVSE